MQFLSGMALVAVNTRARHKMMSLIGRTIPRGRPVAWQTTARFLIVRYRSVGWISGHRKTVTLYVIDLLPVACRVPFVRQLCGCWDLVCYDNCSGTIFSSTTFRFTPQNSFENLQHSFIRIIVQRSKLGERTMRLCQDSCELHGTCSDGSFWLP